MSAEEARKIGKKSKEPTTEASNYTEESEFGGESCQFIEARSTEEQAKKYLLDHKIYELFNFLIGHLLVDEPDDPIEYLGDLLDKCMLFKTDLVEPPLLFTSRHIESLFRSMDPSGTGTISTDQYKMAMKTLGIYQYNECPVQCTPGLVDKQTFEEEAKKCLVKSLAEMLGKCC